MLEPNLPKEGIFINSLNLPKELKNNVKFD